MLRGFATVAVVAMVALLGGMWWISRDTSDDPFAQCRASSVAGGAGAIGGPFELVSETGETVTDKDVITEPSLIYFGYTYCPDICPADSARNAEATEILEEQGIIVQPVLITIDPERDTPEVMAEYTDYLHPRMLGLSGSAEQVKQAAQAYRAYSKRQGDADDEDYLMDHSTFTYLTLPEVGFVEFYRRDMLPEDMAKSVACFVENAPK